MIRLQGLYMEDNISFHRDITAKIFQDKKQQRLQKARLPIEEKVRILIQLQRIALMAAQSRGAKSPGFVWRI